MKKLIACAIFVLPLSMFCTQLSAGASKQVVTPESLKAEIEALRPAKPVWREVKWRTCLLEALTEAREQNKPMLVWVLAVC